MDKELKRKFETLVLYKLTVARIVYAQRWKDTPIPTMQKWMGKVIELAEMAKLTILIKEKNLSSSVYIWKEFLHFVLEMKKNL